MAHQEWKTKFDDQFYDLDDPWNLEIVSNVEQESGWLEMRRKGMARKLCQLCALGVCQYSQQNDIDSIASKIEQLEFDDNDYTSDSNFYNDVLYTTHVGYDKVSSSQKESTSVQVRETKRKHNEIHEQFTWFKATFLDSKRKLKKEIHKELKSFPWLCGAYGITGPNRKIPRLHLFLTVKRGVKKSVVRRDLEDKFKCYPKEYFELLQEPKRKPKIKYLADSSESSAESSASSSVSSVLASPGGGVLACINRRYNDPSPLRIPEENERDGLPEVRGTGTLTMFCYSHGHHYALTCFHVGCANDETFFNAAFNKVEDIQEICSSLSTYVDEAKEKEYWFTEGSVEDNNEPIPFGDDGSNYTALGDFHNYHFDDECDILSLKIIDTEIDCKITGVNSPDWSSIWDELLDMTGQNPVKVEKIGYSSALTCGHIVSCNVSYSDEGNLFQNAIVVKGCGGPFLKGGDSGSLVSFHDKNEKKQVFAYGVCEVDELRLPEQPESTSSTWHENASSEQTSSEDDDSDDIFGMVDVLPPEQPKSTSSTSHENASSEQTTSSDDDDGDDVSETVDILPPEQPKSTKSTLHENPSSEQTTSSDEDDGDDVSETVDVLPPEQPKSTSSTSHENASLEQTSSDDNDSDGSSTWSEENSSDDGQVIFQEGSGSNVSNVKGPYSICLRLDTALEKLGFDNAACVNDCARN
ncbi:Hypothetical predicted protein [Paramuricea clavata]|uniref:Uncharacterized protein n=1 Tax=Paramuricea clavata TaxID=317549 RepID=A0A7D9HNN6_PARCT|nr:Hypothetical predicted protein [Paramuricea clavata]